MQKGVYVMAKRRSFLRSLLESQLYKIQMGPASFIIKFLGFAFLNEERTLN